MDQVIKTQVLVSNQQTDDLFEDWDLEVKRKVLCKCLPEKNGSVFSKIYVQTLGFIRRRLNKYASPQDAPFLSIL